MTDSTLLSDLREIAGNVNVLTERVDQQEQIIAQLMIGWAELGAAFETLLWKVMGDDAESADEFKQHFADVRTGLYQWLNENARVDESPTDLERTIFDMVSREQAGAGAEEQSPADPRQQESPPS